MPYTVRKVDSEYCVYKVLENGELGKRIGCSPTQTGAFDQRIAIQINENKGDRDISEIDFLFDDPYFPYTDRPGGNDPACHRIYRSIEMAVYQGQKCGCFGGGGSTSQVNVSDDKQWTRKKKKG